MRMLLFAILCYARCVCACVCVCLIKQASAGLKLSTFEDESRKVGNLGQTCDLII